MPTPILALDFPTADDAFHFVGQVPEADFFKVGLQLYTAEGPALVRTLKDAGHRIFLDLKFHDIPNTVAGAVRSAAALGADLLTVHASGGEAMLRAAVDAAAGAPRPPQVFAVTVLTSLSAPELAGAWGRGSVRADEEAARLAAVAAAAGVAGVVTSVHEVEAIRAGTRPDFPVLTPGIRLAGGEAGDQARVATPEHAAALGVDYVVIGRPVTAAPDPAAAFRRFSAALARAPGPLPA